MTDEERFREVFAHLGRVAAYARRRGSADPDAIAAETMTVAWRRLDRVPKDDPLPWLYRTARNLLLAERRRAHRRGDLPDVGVEHEPVLLDAELERALRGLTEPDREALLLVAWEDLTPKQAAAVLGVSPTAFRVRLFRARRRLQTLLAPALARLDVEEA